MTNVLVRKRETVWLNKNWPLKTELSIHVKKLNRFGRVWLGNVSQRNKSCANWDKRKRSD
jgi:hypothetical protein